MNGIMIVLTLLSGVALFLYGMSLMGDGLKRVAGNQLELVLYKLTNTPIKGVLLGTIVTAIIQSSSATTVMVVGFVNSGMMKVAQAIGIIMGANIGTSVTGWILCLSYIDGSSGIAQLLSTATISAVVAIIGIIFKMFVKKANYKNVGDIMLGFAILMVGMQTMSGAWQKIAACPVLLSSIGTNKNGKRTALIYLLNDLFGMIFWSIVFYSVNAFVHFKFLNMTMSPIKIAMMNSIFRLATIMILLPCINLIEKLVFRLIKDDPEDLEEQADFDLLEERFLAYPALAIGQSHTAVNGMAKKARKNINRALSLLGDYSQDKYNKVQEKENLIDKYEDKLGTYLMQLTGQEMSTVQMQQVSKFLHTISDFERLGDHAVNISNVANEISEKKITFSESAQKELSVLEAAVREIVDLTVDAFCEDDLEMAAKIEPLRELIGILCNDLKNRHVTRLREGKCEFRQGFAFNDLLTNLERIAAHCSNVAVAMIETETSEFDTHEYLKSVRHMKDDAYLECFDSYARKYSIPPTKKEKKNK